MPVQTAIQVRRGTASSWTSTNPTLAAGEIGFETDTSKFKIGTGSTAWNSLNYFVQDPVTTKGDLYTFSTTDARLAVGNNGETLVADSSASTGLRWQPTQSTQNYIINGGADFWQRGTSAAATLNYLCDRFQFNRAGGVGGSTISRSTDAPTGFQYSIKNQRDSGNTSTAALEGYYSIETSQSLPLAGQTVVLSFYAKKGANYSGGNLSITLANGTGTDQPYYSYTGSNTIVNNTGISLTTSWVRYSVTGTVPTNSTEIGFKTSWTPTGTAGADDSVYMTGFQLEVGSVPTTFRRAGGTLAGELSACQRYYYRLSPAAATRAFGPGFVNATTQASAFIPFPVTMRTRPTALEQSGTATDYNIFVLNVETACNGVPFFGGYTTASGGSVGLPSTGLTAGQGCYGVAATTAAYLGWSAEL